MVISVIQTTDEDVLIPHYDIKIDGSLAAQVVGCVDVVAALQFLGVPSPQVVEALECVSAGNNVRLDVERLEEAAV